MNNENISIGPLNPIYFEISKEQNVNQEYFNILIFLNEYMNDYAKRNNVDREDLNIEFINYGKTELVFVMSNKNERLTLLVKQPAVKYGNILKECNYLKNLAKEYDNIVAPVDYFALNNEELFATPYINQARCIASYDAWGMYVPEPYYRFESFNSTEEDIITQALIAKLLSLYDFEKEEGIINCKLGGGDFILKKGWDNEELTINNILNNLYLTACREKIKCPFDDYIDILLSEFSRATINENEENIFINLRGRVPIKIDNIEKGINIGKSMIIKNSLSYSKKKKR